MTLMMPHSNQEEAFYRRNVKDWRAEQMRIEVKIRRHRDSDENYIEQSIRLLELTQNAAEIYRRKGQSKKAELLRFMMPGSKLHDDKVAPAFNQPFDIIHRIAEHGRTFAPETETASEIPLDARLLLLPGWTRTFGIVD